MHSSLARFLFNAQQPCSHQQCHNGLTLPALNVHVCFTCMQALQASPACRHFRLHLHAGTSDFTCMQALQTSPACRHFRLHQHADFTSMQALQTSPACRHFRLHQHAGTSDFTSMQALQTSPACRHFRLHQHAGTSDFTCMQALQTSPLHFIMTLESSYAYHSAFSSITEMSTSALGQ